MAARKLTLEELPELFGRLRDIAAREARIGVRDPEVSDYVRVLEYGSLAGQRPWPHAGPRTVLVVDPHSGVQLVVTAQSPQGFIRVLVPTFVEHLHNALGEPADWLDNAAVQEHVGQAVRAAAGWSLEEIRAGAPEDSGCLRESLTILD
jgi:hypothetical protein